MSQGLPSCMFLDQASEELIDRRIANKLEFREEGEGVKKQVKHVICNTIPLKEQISTHITATTYIHNIEYSNLFGKMFMSTQTGIQCRQLHDFGLDLQKGQMKESARQCLIPEKGQIFLSPNQQKLAILNQKQLLIYQIANDIISKRFPNNDKGMENITWLNQNQLYGWKFFKEAYSIDINKQSCSRIQGVEVCTAISKVGSNIVLAQGLKLKIFRKNKLSKQIDVSKIENDDFAFMQYNQIFGIERVNNLKSQDFNQEDIYTIFFVFHEDPEDDSQPCLRTFCFLKGNLEQQIVIRGNQIVDSAKDQKKYYMSQKNELYGFQMKTVFLGNFVAINIQNTEKIYAIDLTDYFQNMQVYFFNPPHVLKSPSFFKGITLFRNAIDFEMKGAIKQKEIDTTYLLRLYFNVKQMECFIPFPASIIALDDKQLYRRYAVSTKNTTEADDQDFKQKAQLMVQNKTIQEPKFKSKVQKDPLKSSNQVQKKQQIRQEKLNQNQKKKQGSVNLFANSPIFSLPVDKKQQGSANPFANSPIFNLPVDKKQQKSIFSSENNVKSIFSNENVNKSVISIGKQSKPSNIFGTTTNSFVSGTQKNQIEKQNLKQTQKQGKHQKGKQDDIIQKKIQVNNQKIKVQKQKTSSFGGQNVSPFFKSQKNQQNKMSQQSQTSKAEIKAPSLFQKTKSQNVSPGSFLGLPQSEQNKIINKQIQQKNKQSKKDLSEQPKISAPLFGQTSSIFNQISKTNPGFSLFKNQQKNSFGQLKPKVSILIQKQAKQQIKKQAKKQIQQKTKAKSEQCKKIQGFFQSIRTKINNYQQANYGQCWFSLKNVEKILNEEVKQLQQQIFNPKTLAQIQFTIAYFAKTVHKISYQHHRRKIMFKHQNQINQLMRSVYENQKSLSFLTQKLMYYIRVLVPLKNDCIRKFSFAKNEPQKTCTRILEKLHEKLQSLYERAVKVQNNKQLGRKLNSQQAKTLNRNGEKDYTNDENQDDQNSNLNNQSNQGQSNNQKIQSYRFNPNSLSSDSESQQSASEYPINHKNSVKLYNKTDFRDFLKAFSSKKIYASNQKVKFQIYQYEEFIQQKTDQLPLFNKNNQMISSFSDKIPKQTLVSSGKTGIPKFEENKHQEIHPTVSQQVSEGSEHESENQPVSFLPRHKSQSQPNNGLVFGKKQKAQSMLNSTTTKIENFQHIKGQSEGPLNNMFKATTLHSKKQELKSEQKTKPSLFAQGSNFNTVFSQKDNVLQPFSSKNKQQLKSQEKSSGQQNLFKQSPNQSVIKKTVSKEVEKPKDKKEGLFGSVNQKQKNKYQFGSLSGGLFGNNLAMKISEQSKQSQQDQSKKSITKKQQITGNSLVEDPKKQVQNPIDLNQSQVIIITSEEEQQPKKNIPTKNNNQPIPNQNKSTNVISPNNIGGFNVSNSLQPFSNQQMFMPHTNPIFGAQNRFMGSGGQNNQKQGFNPESMNFSAGNFGQFGGNQNIGNQGNTNQNVLGQNTVNANSNPFKLNNVSGSVNPNNQASSNFGVSNQTQQNNLFGSQNSGGGWLQWGGSNSNFGNNSQGSTQFFNASMVGNSLGNPQASAQIGQNMMKMRNRTDD